jgi:hypothetical protein
MRPAFLSSPFDAQHVAYGRARFDKAEGNSTLHEFCVQRQEHPGASHVDIWRALRVLARCQHAA